MASSDRRLSPKTLMLPPRVLRHIVVERTRSCSENQSQRAVTLRALTGQCIRSYSESQSQQLFRSPALCIECIRSYSESQSQRKVLYSKLAQVYPILL